MGDIWEDGDPDEYPVFEVVQKPFSISRTTVTNEQYLAFLMNTGERIGPELKASWAAFPNRRGVGLVECGRDSFSCVEGYEKHPVVYVSWTGAIAYCEWLSEELGRVCRLPSEVEWQYAAMGPRKLKWSLGNKFVRSHYQCNAGGPVRADVGTESDFGLLHMTGNVFEWCMDEYRASLDKGSDENLLKGSRVIKGGAFIMREAPGFRNSKKFSCVEGSCLNCVGFRVVCDSDD